MTDNTVTINADVQVGIADDTIVKTLRALAELTNDDVVAHDLRALADAIEATSTDGCDSLTADEVVSLIRNRYDGGYAHTNAMSIPNYWVYVVTPARTMDAPRGWEWATPPERSSESREHLKPVENCGEQIDTPEECAEYLRTQVDEEADPAIWVSDKYERSVWISSRYDDVVTLPDGWVYDETLHSPKGSYAVSEEDVPVDP